MVDDDDPGPQVSLGQRMQDQAFGTVSAKAAAEARAKVAALKIPAAPKVKFEPTIGQATRLAQIAREYVHGRMTKQDHDEAWDRILKFRRPK